MFKKLFIFWNVIIFIYVGLLAFYYISFFFLTLVYYPGVDSIDDALAAYEVGKKYQIVDYFTHNPEKAKLYFEKATEFGLLKANAHLAELHALERIELTDQRAIELATNAFETEEAPRAHYALGKIYADKNSQYYDLDKAEAHYIVSAEADFKYSIGLLLDLYEFQKPDKKQYDYWLNKLYEIHDREMSKKVLGFKRHISDWYLN